VSCNNPCPGTPDGSVVCPGPSRSCVCQSVSCWYLSLLKTRDARGPRLAPSYPGRIALFGCLSESMIETLGSSFTPFSSNSTAVGFSLVHFRFSFSRSPAFIPSIFFRPLRTPSNFLFLQSDCMVWTPDFLLSFL